MDNVLHDYDNYDDDDTLTPDALQMHRLFSNAVCVTFVLLALYNIYSQQHTLIHILLNELHIKIHSIINNRKQSTKPTVIKGHSKWEMK